MMKGLMIWTFTKWRHNTASKHIRGSILDLGCGDEEMKRYATTNYLGIDKKTGFNIEIDKIKDKWDAILLLAVLEHLDNPNKLLQKLRNNLKDNGKIIITMPSRLGIIIHSFLARIGLFTREFAEEHKIHKLDFNGYKVIKRRFALFNQLFILTK